MKKRFSCFLCVFLILLLASCDLLGGSLSDYITEYTENANLEVFVIPDVYPRDASQTACVTNPATPIILYLRNPMKYEIVFEYTFHIASIQLLYSVQYQQTDPIQFIPVSDDYSAYSMIFPSAFLDQIDRNAFIDSELSSKDISGTLKAYDKETHREFGSLELTLSANTPPDPVATYMMQLDQDPAGEKADSARYILCFEIPRSDRNGDFDTIKINNSTWKIDYNFGSQDGLKLTPYGGNTGKLLVNPAPTDELPYGIDFYPLEEGSVDKFEPMGLTANPPFDTFYYITGDTRSDTEMLYTLTITDKAGLKSESTVSNKADKLNTATITIPSSPVFDNFYIAGLDNSLTINIKAATVTTKGKPVEGASYEYIVQEVDVNGNLLPTDNIPEWKEDTSGSIQLSPNNTDTDAYYMVSVRSKRRGCLTSDETSTDIFKVIRSNHFFVAHTFEGRDVDNNGTLLYPYYSFSKCMEGIVAYQSNLKETFDRTLPDGFYIDVLGDYNVTGSDDVFNSSYLINNKIDSSTTFSGKLTIQGVDDDGNPLSGTSRRTIDAGSSGGLLSWSAVANNTATLSLKNLTFTNGYSETSGKYAGLYFQTISVSGNPDNNNEKLHVTITNCYITHMTGSYGYGIYFYGGNSSLSDTSTSTVTITDCTISDNEKTGINHSYAAQGSSYEKLILAGNTKIQNNSEGGVSESLGLIIKSKDVTISNNTGYGVSAGAWAKIDIEGATITNNTDASNNPKNLYLVESTNNSGVVSRAKVTLTGSLSGSKIGVTTATAWDEGDALIPFATYSTKPATGVFFSDAGYPVTLGNSEASIGDEGTVSTDIYVNNTTGNDETGTGKKSKPYKTLAKAVEMVSEGGAIRLARDQTFCTGNMETITISKKLTIGAYGEGNPPALDSTRLKIESDPEVRINNIAFKMTAVTGTSSGAFIYNENAKVTCFGCTFTGGKATVGDYAYGGAIYNDGILHLEKCSFNGNEATSEYGSGGAICGLSGYAELINCTFNDNVSKLDGAIWMMDLVLKDCSFSGNKTSAGLLKAGSFIHSLTLQGTNTFQDSELFEMSPLTELPSITIGEEASLDGIDRIPLSWLQGQNTLDFEGKNVFADDYSKSRAAELFTVDDSMGSYVINNGTICKSGISGPVSIATLYSDITINCSTSENGIVTFTGLNDVDAAISYEIWYHGSDIAGTGKDTNPGLVEDGDTLKLDMSSFSYSGTYQILLTFSKDGSTYSASFDFVKE